MSWLITNCPPPSREGWLQPLPWTEQAATTGVFDSVRCESRPMVPTTAIAKIRPETATSAGTRINSVLEERALSSDRSKRKGEQRDDPVELCGSCVQVHRSISSCLGSVVCRQSLRWFSPKSRRKLANELQTRNLLLAERMRLEKRALRGNRCQCQRYQRHKPVKLCRLRVEVHRCISSITGRLLVPVSQRLLAKISPENRPPARPLCEHEIAARLEPLLVMLAGRRRT
jgi:hypothetical protein